MKIIKNKLNQIDWQVIAEEINQKGYAIVPNILNSQECQDLITNFTADALYRKTVIMERYRFGKGAYKYYKYPLPKIIQTIRETLYPKLAPIANLWMKALKTNTTFPTTLQELQNQCHNNNQLLPTPLILKYNKGGFNTLHQDLYGDIYFPLQTVVFLNEANTDYTGGEFVLTQQIPRAQTKAIVLSPKKGDMLIFTTNFRPIKGVKGYYRAPMKHGVSEVHSGERHTLGIIFHDATS